VNLLLDTHVFLWSINGGPFSEAARDAFLDTGNRLFLSSASYWEICIKAGIGRLVLADGWPERFESEMRINGIQWLPIEQSHCRKILELPPIHHDPFDRLLIAQAVCDEMTLLTADGNMHAYPVSILW
jgi:PIN domain nuclease of toxin-antitoxin system